MTDVRVPAEESATQHTADRDGLATIAWLAAIVAVLGAASILLIDIPAYLI